MTTDADTTDKWADYSLLKCLMIFHHDSSHLHLPMQYVNTSEDFGGGKYTQEQMLNNPYIYHFLHKRGLEKRPYNQLVAV